MKIMSRAGNVNLRRSPFITFRVVSAKVVFATLKNDDYLRYSTFLIFQKCYYAYDVEKKKESLRCDACDIEHSNGGCKTVLKAVINYIYI